MASNLNDKGRLQEIAPTDKDQETPELIEASKGEMLLLAGLIHPNLPRIYDYFVENQRWYFVMDFLAGETLEAYTSAINRLSTKRNYRPLPGRNSAGVERQVDAMKNGPRKRGVVR